MDARDFDKIEKRAVTKFLFLQGKAPKEVHVILTETLACFLLGRAKDLSAPLYSHCRRMIRIFSAFCCPTPSTYVCVVLWDVTCTTFRILTVPSSPGSSKSSLTVIKVLFIHRLMD